MSKLIVITPSTVDAANKLKLYGLTIQDARIVKRYEDICGTRDMLMLYAGDASMLPDFDKIIDYCMSHDIKCIKTNSGHDFVSESPHHPQGQRHE